MNIPPQQVPPKKIPVLPSHGPLPPSIRKVFKLHSLSDLVNPSTNTRNRNQPSPKTLPLSFENRQACLNGRSSRPKPAPHSSVIEEDVSESFGSIDTRWIEASRFPDRAHTLSDSHMRAVNIHNLQRNTHANRTNTARYIIVKGRPLHFEQNHIKSDARYSAVKASVHEEPTDDVEETAHNAAVAEHKKVSQDRGPIADGQPTSGGQRRAPCVAPPESEVVHQGRVWIRSGPFGFRKWRCAHGFICSTDLGNMLFLLDIDNSGRYLQNKSASISLFIASARAGENKLKQGGFSYRFQLLTPKRKYMMGVRSEDIRNDWLIAFNRVSVNSL